MENIYTPEQQEQIKKLIKFIEDNKMEDPYKTETYRMGLSQIIGNKINTGIAAPAAVAAEVRLPRKKKMSKSVKTGRGNKSEVSVKIENLISTDFFDSAKTMRDIQAKLRDEGYNIDLSKISPTLFFLVREGKIKRTKNEHKRFVYFKNHNHSGHSNNQSADLSSS